ncbi:PREDICTED: extensin-like [Erythranthe guttata]|uniref:extensin-like n=1 Tax=Erythranthe guttata TaxID=4155 RepID=UPI00064D7826|nr:PREDICTED: extensin-like [Erythranthe guttata]|eukprot:XP_012848257.1 PREDICTED: extensin-like [Erythranthe guttata]
MAVSIMSLLFVILTEFSCLVHALKFYVGGDDGWNLKPSKNYIHCADDIAFRSTMKSVLFKYKKGHDSVLVVNENDYSKCNKENPIKILKEGDSKFKFEKSGPFFFISGHNQNCEKGEKLIVVVLSDRHRNTTHNAPSPLPETPLKPPSHSPSPSPSPSMNKPPALAPVAHHSPTPSHAPPTHSPSPSPAAHTAITHHSPTPSPAAKSPTHAPPVKPPSHSPSPSPAAPAHITHHSPSPSPASKSPTHAPPVKPPSHSPSPALITHHSPNPSPAAKTPLHAPPAQPHSKSPAPSPAAKSTTHVPPSY